MIFDRPPAELPVATLRPRAPRARFAAAVSGWVAARWTWFRPRAIPCVVALAGMLALLGSAEYLRSFADHIPERLQVKLVRHADGVRYTAVHVDPDDAAAATRLRAMRTVHAP